MISTRKRRVVLPSNPQRSFPGPQEREPVRELLAWAQEPPQAAGSDASAVRVRLAQVVSEYRPEGDAA